MRYARVCVVGAGAIGSLYAAHLARVSDVSVLVRRDVQARALQRGLRISGKSSFTVALDASTDAPALPAPDLVILAPKATQLEAAVESVAGLWPRAVVMTVQNGLGAEETVRRHGAWPIISAVTFMSGVRHGDAHVEYELDTATWMGPYAPTGTPQEAVAVAVELLELSGLHAQGLPDLRPAQWSKLIFNSAVNTVAALTGLPHVRAFAELDDVTDVGHVVRGLMEEGTAVARAAGVALHADPWEMNLRAVARGETGAAHGAYAHLPSMLEDVRHQRPTEVDFITGALVREAGRLGVPAPLNATVWRLVKGVERSWPGAARQPEPVPA